MFRSWGCRCQWGLGSKNFFSESWILNLEPRKLCKVCKDSGIQDSRFSEKVLESKSLDLGVVDISEGLDSKTFSQNLESWIQKALQSLQSFWDSRFKIIPGDSMCVCVHVGVYMVIGILLYIYIYILHPPQVNQTLVLNPKMSVLGGYHIYIYIYICVCVHMCVCLW